MVDLRLGAEADGLTVAAFEEQARVRVAAVSRDDEVVLATPELELAPGDQVTAAMHRSRRRHVTHLLERT
nr:TrkA C-terminal domain-containing protein [Salsipaludibacter albus]